MMFDLDPFERRAVRAALRRQRRYILHDLGRDHQPGATELHRLRLGTLDGLLEKITDPTDEEIEAHLILQGRAP